MSAEERGSGTKPWWEKLLKWYRWSTPDTSDLPPLPEPAGGLQKDLRTEIAELHWGGHGVNGPRCIRAYEAFGVRFYTWLTFEDEPDRPLSRGWHGHLGVPKGVEWRDQNELYRKNYEDGSLEDAERLAEYRARRLLAGLQHREAEQRRAAGIEAAMERGTGESARRMADKGGE